MIHVALYEPEIPGNTGNIARLCAGVRAPLHIVGKPVFDMDDKAVRRAGLDYWPHVPLHRHDDLAAFLASEPRLRVVYLTTKASRAYTDWTFAPDDCIMFGPETRGLPTELLRAAPERCLMIPMLEPAVRSLNLANSAAIVLYEALRQVGAFAQWENSAAQF